MAGESKPALNFTIEVLSRSAILLTLSVQVITHTRTLTYIAVMTS